MTIKEIEALSGMTRANIRYYESEGLLNPTRKENGYRDYSEEDLTQLRRIRLLRALNLPLEEIKALHRGEAQLSDTLAARLAALEQEEERLGRTEAVCRQMQQDHADFATLDAPHYLDLMERPAPKPQEPDAPDTPAVSAAVPEEDVPDIGKIWWRRYFARALDYALWGLPVALLWRFAYQRPDRDLPFQLLDIALTMLVMLALEPLCLHFFGTTPGKWVLGLSVTNSNGQRLTLREARQRTMGMLQYGVGFFIPFYALYRYALCYRRCKSGHPMEWDVDTGSELILRDRKLWRAVAYVGLRVAAGALALLLLLAGAALPPHRGALTVAQFAENYNTMNRYLGTDLLFMDEAGRLGAPAGVYIVEVIPSKTTLTFSQQDGVITGVTLERRVEEDSPYVFGNPDLLAVLMAAYVDAQPAFALWEVPALMQVVELIRAQPLGNFSTTLCGVTISCTTESEGYVLTSSFGETCLMAEEGAESQQFRQVFTVKME